MFEASCVKVEFPLEGIHSRETLWEGVWEKAASQNLDT